MCGSARRFCEVALNRPFCITPRHPGLQVRVHPDAAANVQLRPLVRRLWRLLHRPVLRLGLGGRRPPSRHRRLHRRRDCDRRRRACFLLATPFEDPLSGARARPCYMLETVFGRRKWCAIDALTRLRGSSCDMGVCWSSGMWTDTRRGILRQEPTARARERRFDTISHVGAGTTSWQHAPCTPLRAGISVQAVAVAQHAATLEPLHYGDASR